MTFDELYWWWSDRFPSCGCGDPDAVLARLRDLLREIHARDEERIRSNYSAEPFPTPVLDALQKADEPSFYLWLYLFDNLGLTEHGSNARYSWLTDKGRDLLHALETWGDKYEDWHEMRQFKDDANGAREWEARFTHCGWGLAIKGPTA